MRTFRNSCQLFLPARSRRPSCFFAFESNPTGKQEGGGGSPTTSLALRFPENTQLFRAKQRPRPEHCLPPRAHITPPARARKKSAENVSRQEKEALVRVRPEQQRRGGSHCCTVPGPAPRNRARDQNRAHTFRLKSFPCWDPALPAGPEKPSGSSVARFGSSIDHGSKAHWIDSSQKVWNCHARVHIRG